VDQAPPLDGPACRAADPADREALFCRRQPTAPTPAPSGLLPVEPHSVAELKLDGVRGPLLANKANRGGNTCPVGVKGGCSGQVDGTAGLPQLPKCRVRPGSYAWCQIRTRAHDLLKLCRSSSPLKFPYRSKIVVQRRKPRARLRELFNAPSRRQRRGARTSHCRIGPISSPANRSCGAISARRACRCRVRGRSH
jgi:hypothetical protein